MINDLLPIFTLVLGIFLISFGIYFFIIYFFKYDKQLEEIKYYFNLIGGELIFFISLVATLGSLYYSEILNYNPCLLCWYQRIFMYPLVIISAVYIWKKSKDLIYAILPISLLGAFFAGYHYYTQFLPSVMICSLEGDCSLKEFISFGYITIPMMALTGFIAIIIISVILLKIKKK